MMNHFFLPFRGVFCRVSPIAFDGTLSFLELVNKLQYYVNELANNLNDLETALEEFEQYVETALDEKQDVLTWDTVPTAGSENPVYSYGIKDYVDHADDAIYTYVNNGLNDKQDVLTWDSIPTNGSLNPVTSDGLFDYITEKMNLVKYDINITLDDGTPVIDRNFTEIYLMLMRGAVLNCRYSHGANEFDINEDFLTLQYFTSTTIELANSRYTAILDSSNTLTVTANT